MLVGDPLCGEIIIVSEEPVNSTDLVSPIVGEEVIPTDPSVAVVEEPSVTVVEDPSTTVVSEPSVTVA